MKNMYKIVSVLVIAVLAVTFYLNASAKSDVASATYGQHGDDCNEVFTYDNEVNDSRVLIDTINTGSQGNPDSITVTAKTGYSVISVKIELDDNDTSGWDVQTSGNLSSYNPQGTTIEDFEVKVKKVCATATPTVTPSKSPTPTPTATPTVTPTITITPTVTPTATPAITETPTITPTPSIPQGGICDEGQVLNGNGVCINIECDGGGTCEVTNVSPTPTVTPTETVTPSPTNTPSQGGTSSNSSSSNNSSNESKNEAAAVTAYAPTGNFVNGVSNAIFALGASLTALSAAVYGKKKKTNKK